MKDFLLSHLNDVLLALINVQNILQQYIVKCGFVMIATLLKGNWRICNIMFSQIR